MQGQLNFITRQFDQLVLIKKILMHHLGIKSDNSLPSDDESEDYSFVNDDVEENNNYEGNEAESPGSRSSYNNSPIALD